MRPRVTDSADGQNHLECFKQTIRRERILTIFLFFLVNETDKMSRLRKFRDQKNDCHGGIESVFPPADGQIRVCGGHATGLSLNLWLS